MFFSNLGDIPRCKRKKRRAGGVGLQLDPRHQVVLPRNDASACIQSGPFRVKFCWFQNTNLRKPQKNPALHFWVIFWKHGEKTLDLERAPRSAGSLAQGPGGSQQVADAEERPAAQWAQGAQGSEERKEAGGETEVGGSWNGGTPSYHMLSYVIIHFR